MPKTKEQKQAQLNAIKNKMDNSTTFIVSTFDKVAVADDQELRSQLRKNQIEHQVVKKTLLNKVFSDNKVTGLEADKLSRNIAVTASQDEVTGAKILDKFSSDHEDFHIVGGLLHSAWVDASKITELAKLPSKPELIAKTVGTIKAPLNGFVNVLAGNVRGLVNVLNSIKDQKV